MLEEVLAGLLVILLISKLIMPMRKIAACAEGAVSLKPIPAHLGLILDRTLSFRAC